MVVARVGRRPRRPDLRDDDGSLLTDWVETYEDANDNGIEDADEHGTSWFYWLVDPDDRRGVTVRSTRPPASIFTLHGLGRSSPEPHYLASDDDRGTTPRCQRPGSTWIRRPSSMRPSSVGQTVPFDLAAARPSDGTAVDVDGLADRRLSPRLHARSSIVTRHATRTRSIASRSPCSIPPRSAPSACCCDDPPDSRRRR